MGSHFSVMVCHTKDMQLVIAASLIPTHKKCILWHDNFTFINCMLPIISNHIYTELYYKNTEEIENVSTCCVQCWEARREAECFPNTFWVFWQIPKCFITAHSTVDKFSISFIKYKSLRSFARAVGSYKPHTTANQIACNMSVILHCIITSLQTYFICFSKTWSPR
jgi:hypothetical protein